MRVTITGINFKYDDGYNQEYTGVELQSIGSDFKIGKNNPVEITKEQYEENKSNANGLRSLIVDKKLDEANGYVDDLNEYKDSLSAE